VLRCISRLETQGGSTQKNVGMPCCHPIATLCDKLIFSNYAQQIIFCKLYSIIHKTFELQWFTEGFEGVNPKER